MFVFVNVNNTDPDAAHSPGSDNNHVTVDGSLSAGILHSSLFVCRVTRWKTLVAAVCSTSPTDPVSTCNAATIHSITLRRARRAWTFYRSLHLFNAAYTTLLPFHS